MNSISQFKNLEPLFRKVLPILFELLGNQPLDWLTIGKVTQRSLNKRRERIERTGGGIFVETSLVDVIMGIVLEKPHAKSMYLFIKRLLEELAQHLDDNEKTLIKDNIFGLLTNVDLKYLNHLGELCILNAIKKQLGYKLVATEFPRVTQEKEGSKIDFRFLIDATGSYLLVEVVSLHLPIDKKLDDAAIENILMQKIPTKLKTKGIQQRPDFYLAPILWGRKELIESFIDYYEKVKPTFQNTLIPSCFVAYHYGNDEIIHEFGSIDTILKDH
ncbi:MAG: hypothetical protein HOP08_19900 [Cyclobacteriaceae bacterium]|nr:hypothetical protein [Cyclobacteriaceae bacterium]